MAQEDEENLPRSVPLQNAHSILSARKRTEQELVDTKDELEQRTRELARSLALIQATLEATTDGILTVDKDDTIVTFNRNWVELFRLTPELAAAKHHRTLLEGISKQVEGPHVFLRRSEEIRVSNAAESFDQISLTDGRVFERFSKLQMVDGERAGRVWIVRDITERKRAEEALRDETRVLELLNQTGATIASTLELESLVQAVTDAATQLSGARFGAFFYNSENDQGEILTLYTLSGAPRDAFERFGQPRATALFGPTFRGEGPVRCHDVTKDARYGHMMPHKGMPRGHLPVCSYLAVPVISRAGKVFGGMFFGHPEPGMFTERHERIMVGIAGQAAVAMDNALLYEAMARAAHERSQLLEAERAARQEVERVSLMKDEFLATLSHELRTPLNAILGWSELLLRRDVADAQRPGLETIARNARVQTQLVDDLLDMSRIVSGNIRLDVQRTEMPSVIRAAIDSVSHSAEGKGITLRAVVDPLAGPVSGDPGRLQQVVWNLLTNAIKFTPKGGKVDVLLERVNSHLELTVRDTGVGIEPAFLPHMFERFRQADSSTTRRFGGLGIGLSIVKQLVELHGGTVRAASDGQGRGATFTVSLPFSAVRHDEGRTHPRSASQPPPGAQIDLRDVRVLVIDDQPDARELIRSVLADYNADVMTAGSAAAGLDLMSVFKPHVIISDIGMPEQDGYAFIRQVRGLPGDEGGRTPAIALTAFARSEDRTRAMLAGYQIHMAKPIEAHELVVTVGSLANRTQLLAETPR
jgi:PAS domain S-box-containing protein